MASDSKFGVISLDISYVRTVIFGPGLVWAGSWVGERAGGIAGSACLPVLRVRVVGVGWPVRVLVGPSGGRVRR